MADTTTETLREPRDLKKPKKSKATRWRAAVLIGVHLLVAIHIAHWMSSGETLTPLEPSDAMEFSKESVINAGFVFFGLTILSTLVLGRWFCGWGCHVVALQDLSRALLIKIGLRPRPLRSRWMLVIPVMAGLYMFVWPLVYRLWIGDDLAVHSVEMTKENFWETFTDSWFMALLTLGTAGFACVYFLGAKGFCTYACPYGAFFVAADRLSPGRIRVDDSCVQCGHCTIACTSNVDVSREVHDYGMVVDPGCMKCMDCVSVCPEDALHFGFGKPALFAKPTAEKPRPKPKGRPFVEEISGLVAALFAYVAWRGWRQEGDFLLSVGLAACFGFLVTTAVRLVRRSDVNWPGVVLKRGGKLRAAAYGLFAVVVGTVAVAVPYGVVTEVHATRAWRADKRLEDAKARWFQSPAVELSDEERRDAETLLAAGRYVDAHAQRETLFNTMRIVWGGLLLGDEEAVEPALARAVAVVGAGPDPLQIQAQRQLAAGDRDAAVETLVTIVERFPSFSSDVFTLARLQTEQGDLEGAAATLERGIDANPDAAGLVAQRALIDADLGRIDEAAAGLERAVELQPDDIAVRDLVRTTLRGLQRYEAAIRVLQEGVDLPGAPVEWRADLPQLLVAVGRPDDAAEAARSLAANAGGDGRLLTVAAAVLEMTGHPDEAAEIRARPVGAAAPPPEETQGGSDANRFDEQSR